MKLSLIIRPRDIEIIEHRFLLSHLTSPPPDNNLICCSTKLRRLEVYMYLKSSDCLAACVGAVDKRAEGPSVQALLKSLESCPSFTRATP